MIALISSISFLAWTVLWFIIAVKHDWPLWTLPLWCLIPSFFILLAAALAIWGR